MRERGRPDDARTDPRVSVIIPCYEAAHFVSDAVASILEQGEPDVEILVVDDGSPDRDALTEALAPFGSAVTLLDGPHLGLAGTRNRGIEAARGRYLAFLDADDAWKPGFLARQLEILEGSDADVVYCDAEHFGRTEDVGRSVMERYPSRGDVTLGSVLSGECLVVMSTVVARAEHVRAVGGFDAERAFCEDLDLWARMLLNGTKFTYHREPLALRRVHGANMSSRAVEMLEGALDVCTRYHEAGAIAPGERLRVDRRIRAMRAELHLYAGKDAVRKSDAKTARREMWASFRGAPAWKPLVAFLMLSLAPQTALGLLSARLD